MTPKKLSARRRRLGITSVAMAKMLKMNHCSLSLQERGRREMNAAIASRYDSILSGMERALKTAA